MMRRARWIAGRRWVEVGVVGSKRMVVGRLGNWGIGGRVWRVEEEDAVRVDGRGR